MKLFKKLATEWKGNGFGSDCAQWGIVGYEDHTLRGETGSWSVFTAEGKRVITGHSRKEAAEMFVEVMELRKDDE